MQKFFGLAILKVELGLFFSLERISYHHQQMSTFHSFKK